MDLTNLENIINGLQSFNTHDEVRRIIDNNEDELVILQKEQLMEGTGVDGGYIRPFYSEDPYFKTREAAMRYAAWKEKITPNVKRPMDVPNLYINGYYVHNQLGVNFSGDEFSFNPGTSKGQEIMDEHPNAAGLSPENRLYFAEEKLLPEFAVVFKEKTNLLIN